MPQQPSLFAELADPAPAPAPEAPAVPPVVWPLTGSDPELIICAAAALWRLAHRQPLVTEADVWAAMGWKPRHGALAGVIGQAVRNGVIEATADAWRWRSRKLEIPQ